MSDGAGKFVAGGALSKVMSAMDKSMGTEAMAEVTRSADQMVASAKSGGFKVTPEAADPIIKVLEDFIDRITTMMIGLDVFDQAPPLGDHAYGKLVAQRMHEAANDERSGRAALNSLQIVLERSREALLRASNQYQEQEESAQNSFRGLDG
ncbi:hypothetical protein [Saccharomonospora cyanea]|uniref:Uncharacterized protein n=1 Tax=Saccharomonospora cyanea NA-134 TaxID=882082 RepID=H5XH76_9PSEU|nr:hypothetical protein [Saccharomonospora cyanea]EHR59547.1 hypothetical protein SaccyDRAFT_0619 [Saccharomonospora cyanea NA-134]